MAAGFLAPLVRRPAASLRLVRTDGVVIADRLEVAFDSASRRRGLLGRESMDPRAALIIAPCSAVHTFFMRFAIDLVFAARDGRVTRVCPDLVPWRLAGSLSGFAAIELAAGRARSLGIRADEIVLIEPHDVAASI